MVTAPSRRGFGLIELLVVIAILVVLAALLLPAVMRVRQSSARLQTINNLKQCALAVHSLHDNYKRFPHAFSKSAHEKKGIRTMWFELLPFVEQNNVLQKDAADSSVIAVYNAPVDNYLIDAKGKLSFSANIRIFGFRTYTGEACNAAGKAMNVKDAKTDVVSGLSMGRIDDGTTNTIMLSTRMSSCDRDEKGNAVHTLINGDPGTRNGGFFGASAVSLLPAREYVKTPEFMYQITPKDFDELPLGQSLKCVNNASAVPHSLTGAKLDVALCDGSVRTIGSAVSPQTYACALSPGDGNALGLDWENE